MLARTFPIFGVLILAACTCSAATITVDVSKDLGPISPLIYGANHDIEGYQVRDARRLGGNRLTGYNWEIDASHAGKDYRHQHDRWLTTNDAFWKATSTAPPPAGTIGGALVRFQDESRARGSYSLVTIPIAGYVAADADGPVAEADAAPSARWARVEPASPAGTTMRTDDGVVYIDQMTRFLVDRYGAASETGAIRGYSLDNEPALWHKTHARLRPQPVTCRELIDRSIPAAAAIKSVDPAADVYGPASWGMTEYVSLSNAEDWPTIKAKEKYRWFLDYYLDSMKRASDRSGKRFLDVLDVHWYTEDAPAGTSPSHAAHSARALYDPTHTEPNWIGKHFSQYLPLIQKLQASVDKYYPGTRLAITEYDWPLTDTVYGGIAQADALGAFGKFGVYFAAYHHKVAGKKDAYVASAFNLYRNYDGKGGTFGDRAVACESDAAPSVIGYASTKPDSVHIIVINRDEHETPATLRLANARVIRSAEQYLFDATSAKLRRGGALAEPVDGEIKLALEPFSVRHVVLSLEPAK